MFKIFTRVAIIVLVILVSIKIAYASLGIYKGFGGKILDSKATEIQTLEDSDYWCAVPGTSITIKPIGNYPTSYVIPYSVKSKTNTTPRSGQWIIGLYSPIKTTVTCILQSYPWTSTTVTLDTISLYGTSK